MIWSTNWELRLMPPSACNLIYLSPLSIAELKKKSLFVLFLHILNLFRFSILIQNTHTLHSAKTTDTLLQGEADSPQFCYWSSLQITPHSAQICSLTMKTKCPEKPTESGVVFRGKYVLCRQEIFYTGTKRWGTGNHSNATFLSYLQWI